MLHGNTLTASYAASKQSLGVEAEITGIGTFTISSIISLHQITLFCLGRQTG